jgi:hypothetical protein
MLLFGLDRVTTQHDGVVVAGEPVLPPGLVEGGRNEP